MLDTNYDFIIIGAGSTGLTAASMAAQIGVKVILVEGKRIGGDCTWTGCIPSKSLLYSASVIQEFNAGKEQGWFTGELDINFPEIKNFVRKAIDDIATTETPDILREEGIDVVLGKAKFISQNKIEVNGEIYTGKKFLIATGAKPIIPLIEGVNKVPFHTYETIFDIEPLPSHLIIIGGGPISCEMGQAFRTFGSKVSIIQEKDRLLRKDDPDASNLLAEVFRQEGIELFFNQHVEKILYSDQTEVIEVLTKNTKISGDALLLAVDRKPNIDSLNLDAIGVNINEQGGIIVDKNLTTSQNNIYAAGDCIGGLQFTHLGGYQGFIATRNALFPGNMTGLPENVPWTTFTHPAVAHVGLSNLDDYKKPEEVETCFWPLTKVDRAVTESKTKGFIKIFYKKDGTILGVTIVAPHAGEMIHEWIFAMDQGRKIGDIAETIHVYPTYSIGSMRAAATIRTNQVLSGISGKLIRGVARFFR